MILSIEQFYQDNIIDNDFDENFYIKEYPITETFYQPHCEALGFTEKERLYYHYYYFGSKLSMYKNGLEKLESKKKEDKLRGRDNIDLLDIDKYINEK